MMRVEPDRIRLTDERLELVLTRRGGIQSLVDRAIGRDYIVPSTEGERPLFRLVCADVRGGRVLPGSFHLLSTEAGDIGFEPAGDGVRFRFSRIYGSELSVVVTVELSAEPGYANWRFYVSGRAPFAVRAVELPVIVTPASLGTRSEDRILVPRHDGYLVGSPTVSPWFEEGKPVEHQRFPYPGEGREFPRGLSVQLSCYYDGSGGLYLATHDAGGHPKVLGPSQGREGSATVLDFTPSHVLPEVPGTTWHPDYDTVVGCFSGDWQDAATTYKKWAVSQPWCRRSLVMRPDIPEWVKRGAFFFNFRLRHQPGGTAFLDAVPDFLDRWKEALGVPLVAMMCGWENVDEWTGPDYFPPYGGEHFRRLCGALKDRSIQPFPFGLSGLKIGLRKRLGPAAPQPQLAADFDGWDEFFSTYEQDAVRVPGGALLLDSNIETWDGIHAYACIATPLARRQLYGATMRLVREYGVRVSQADQVFNGGTAECYAPHHDHPPGRGAWQVDRLRAIYDETRREAKLVDPDFLLSQEWQSEIFLQDLDVYHARSWDQPRGLIGVPLFAFLYHEYLPCYGGDWGSFQPDNTSGVHYHGANFVNGCLPAGCPQTMWKEVINHPPEDADARILRMARNAARSFARNTEYLVYGAMLRDLPLDVPTVAVVFVGIDFYGWPKRAVEVPSVLHRAWRAPDGKCAVALANISGSAQTLRLPVPPQCLPAARAVISRNGADARPLVNGPGIREVELTLEAEDAAVVEFFASTTT
jgi:hypothetical protein